MTCIAAWRDASGIAVGCDSAVSTGGGVLVNAIGKMFRSNGMIYAGCGDVYLLQMLYSARLPRHPADGQDPMLWAHRELVPLIRAIVQGNLDHDHKERPLGVILAVQGAILSIDGDGAIVNPRQSFIADGTGAPVAYGAFHELLRRRRPLTPAEYVRRAIEAACAYHEDCAGPIDVLEL